MKTVKELVEKLNDLKIQQQSVDWIEDTPQDIWEGYLKGNHNEIESGIQVDSRRWYETSIKVYSLLDGFLGVKSITNLFSESSSCSDIGLTLEFYEMKPIQTTTYSII